MQGSDEEVCPRCGSPGLKWWEDLDGDQKLLAERLPASTEYSRAERKKHRFCTRCWFEEMVEPERRA